MNAIATNREPAQAKPRTNEPGLAYASDVDLSDVDSSDV
jgi:hypothetical protein